MRGCKRKLTDTSAKCKPILICLGLLIIGLSLSCQPAPPVTPSASQELPETSTPNPSPSTPGESNPGGLPSEGWLADGVIGDQEYASGESYGDYEIYWTSDDQYIYLAMKARTTGWVALGIQPGSRMKNADLIIGFIQDGETSIFDEFSTGDFGPHPEDTELSGNFDVSDFGGQEANGYTVIEFKRALDTGDQYDNPLSSGDNQIIWAYGSGDSATMKHANRGYGEITLP